MRAAFYGLITVCGVFLAYAFAEAPDIRAEVIGMTVGVVLIYVGAIGLRIMGGDKND